MLVWKEIGKELRKIESDQKHQTDAKLTQEAPYTVCSINMIQPSLWGTLELKVTIIFQYHPIPIFKFLLVNLDSSFFKGLKNLYYWFSWIRVQKSLLLLLLSWLSPVQPCRGQPTRLLCPGIPQARILELGAVSSSNAWKWKVKMKSLSRVRLFKTS